jgi:hypothetical protein
MQGIERIDLSGVMFAFFINAKGHKFGPTLAHWTDVNMADGKITISLKPIKVAE